MAFKIPTVNDELDVLDCTVDIQVTDGLADVCTVGEVVTYTILDRNGGTALDYEGTLVLTNDKTNGDYVASGELGTFDNATADDGIATYAFHADDDGVLTVTDLDNGEKLDSNLNIESYKRSPFKKLSFVESAFIK